MQDIGDMLWKIWVLVCTVIIGPFIIHLLNRWSKKTDDLETRLTLLEKNMMSKTEMLALHQENKILLERFTENFDKFSEATRNDRHNLREYVHEIGMKGAEDRILLRGINERAAEDRGMLTRALEKLDNR